MILSLSYNTDCIIGLHTTACTIGFHTTDSMIGLKLRNLAFFRAYFFMVSLLLVDLHPEKSTPLSQVSYPGYQRFFLRAAGIFGVGLTETGKRARKVSGTQGTGFKNVSKGMEIKVAEIDALLN